MTRSPNTPTQQAELVWVVRALVENRETGERIGKRRRRDRRGSLLRVNPDRGAAQAKAMNDGLSWSAMI